MESKHLTIFLYIFVPVHCIVRRCNIDKDNLNSKFKIRNGGFVLKDSYRNGINGLCSNLINYKSTAFIASTSFASSNFYNSNLKLSANSNDDLNKPEGQDSNENLSDDNSNVPLSENYNLNDLNPSSSTPLSQNVDDNLSKEALSTLESESHISNLERQPVIGGLTGENESEDVTHANKYANAVENTGSTACKLVKYNEGVVGKFVSKLDLKSRVSSLCNKVKMAKEVVANSLYPMKASKEVIRFTNWKMLERIFLSMSSTVALNVKPLAITDAEQNKGMVGFLRNKFAKTKLSTLIFASVFKDLFSKIINYYWFNKVVNVQNRPSLYRVVSTSGFSLLALWDFLINFEGIEPKTLLLAVNHVFKQMFNQTINATSQWYYDVWNNINQQRELSSPVLTGDFNGTVKAEAVDGDVRSAKASHGNQDNDVLLSKMILKNLTNSELSAYHNQIGPVREFKDEYGFVFDFIGMSLGMYVSYLINEVNSNELKVAAICSNLVIANTLTMIISRYLKT